MSFETSQLTFAAGLVWAAVAVVVGVGCSFIRFERGPYVIRDLQVVYSQQEQMTFLSWNLRDDADLSRVHFEIRRDGRYRQIDLDSAPYPAEPWACEEGRICFQYQVRGEYQMPEEASPLHSEHDRHGTFAAPDPSHERVERTFDVDPVAVERNAAIKPRRFDWFTQNDVPLKRDFQWRFVPRDDEKCREGDASWTSLDGRISVEGDWVEEPVCLAARPRWPGGQPVSRRVPLPPSAETYNERQTYVPERLEPPIVYGILVDLSIPSPTRCEQVRETIVTTLQESIEGEGETRNLGVFRPISTESGEELSGCRQESGRRYPLSKMYREADRLESVEEPPELKIVWIYLNNIQLEPEENIAQQLERLVETAPAENNLEVFNWVIGANPILEAVDWDHRTGWRPIEDETLTADLEDFVETTLPFSTMDHGPDTEVPIEPPQGVDDPEAFKICEASPFPVEAVGIESGEADYDVSSPFVPWPDTGKPFYKVRLPEQTLVHDVDYDRFEVNVDVEACVRFCDNRFESRSGELFPSWKEPGVDRPMEVCQWVD